MYLPDLVEAGKEFLMKWILVGVLAAMTGLGAGHAATEQPASKPPEKKSAWLWTDEERLAARFAPGAVKARAGAGLRSPESPRTQPPPGQGTPTDYVSGEANPELLLPEEMLSSLLTVLYIPSDRPQTAKDRYRTGTIGRAEEYGLPRDFDTILQRETAEFVRLQAGHLERSLAIRSQEMAGQEAETLKRLREDNETTGRLSCPALHQALDGLRRSLGEERYASFLHLVYETVAPRMKIVGFGDEPQAELRELQAGCR